MSTEVRAWFTGRLPDEWFSAPAEITVDREEITIMGTLPEPEADDAVAAAEGRIKRFREDTRVRRIRSEERRVGKECERLCRSRWSPYH